MLIEPKPGGGVRVLITGSTGQLGPYLLKEFSAQRYTIAALSRMEHAPLFGVKTNSVDLGHSEAIREIFLSFRPNLVIHAAAMSRVHDAFSNPTKAFELNEKVTRNLARLCNDVNARLVYTSTDMVFDGISGSYHELCRPNPLSVYGKSKLAGEIAASEARNSAVARLPLMFGPNLVTHMSQFEQIISSLRSNQVVQLFCDEWRSSCSFATAARELRIVAEAEYKGVIHLGGGERVSRHDIGTAIARLLYVNENLVQKQLSAQTAHAEERPKDLSFDLANFRKTFPEFTILSLHDDVRANIALL